MVCPPSVSFIQHADPRQGASSGIKLSGGAPEDINPYQLSGVRGVYEHKVVNAEGEDQMIYIRLDVPDTSETHCVVLENFSSKRDLVFGAKASKDEYYSRFDEAERDFSGTIVPLCKCCNYTVLKFENENGVLRLLLCKSDSNPDPQRVIHCLVDTEIPEHMPGTSKPQPRNRSTRPVHNSSDPTPMIKCHNNPSRQSGYLQPSTVDVPGHMLGINPNFYPLR